ncbi:hypothetical protein F511_26328 [Dorcoceras hygrometricum]|uniref:Uncharacterized protein n=1 Tax=Dorcoceras hygrometricum TaxID=472368 RepID=A0A2Z7ATU6_9LAMI|nr:hypothetical protein F511_26328 [Dorcoceras hygrometricum]
MGCPGQARTKPRRKIQPTQRRGDSPDGGGHRQYSMRRMAARCRAKRGVFQPHRAPSHGAQPRPARNNLRTGLTASVLAIVRPACGAAINERPPSGNHDLTPVDFRKSHFQNPPPMLNTLSSVSVRESRIQYLCDPQWFRDTASRGPTTIAAPESQFRTCPSDHGITDSACKNQVVVVSVQYGPFNPYIPIRSTTIGKSRVAIDPIAMHTSWRSNSDIVSVTSIGYPRMSASGESSTTMHRLLHASGPHPTPSPNDPKANQYNQDLGLIHSTNGNHLESPNEGSSIDHQVTIYLHAQNITMFPTN